jgi:hypothetical protein
MTPARLVNLINAAAEFQWRAFENIFFQPKHHVHPTTAALETN